MSLGIIIKAPEGLVLAAESRVTLAVQQGNQTFSVNYDNATKLFSFKSPYHGIGVITYGQAAIGVRTAQSFIPEFETVLPPVDVNHPRMTVLEFANLLSRFFLTQWNQVMPPNYNGQEMTFNVCGFDDNEPYGKVFAFNIPRTPTPIEQNAQLNNQHQFGITSGGQTEIIQRIITGYDNRIFQILLNAGIIQQAQMPQITLLLQQLQLQTPIQFMPLQDCVNLASLFIRATIETQSLTVQLRGCGGQIDIAVITRNKPLEFISKKQITA